MRLLAGDCTSAPVLLLDESAGGLGLRSSSPIPISQPLLIEFEDDLFLGEACYCLPGEDGFRVGIKVEHCVRGRSALLKLADSVAAAGLAPPLPSTAPVT